MRFNKGDLVRRKSEKLDDPWWVEICKYRVYDRKGVFTVDECDNLGVTLVELPNARVSHYALELAEPPSLESFL